MIGEKATCLALSLHLALAAGLAKAQSCDEYPDFALSPAPLNTEPGAEYAEWARSYQGMPSIERMSNGRLWAAWTSGGATEGPDNYIVLATSTNDGKTWSRPVLVVDPPGNVAAFVPVLWRDPEVRLWMFWNQAYGAWWDGRGGAWGVVATGAETGSPEWGVPGRIADGWPGGKPVVVRSGDWLLPVFVSHGASKLGEENDYYRLGLTPCVVDALSHDLGKLKGANVYRSADAGSGWQLLGQANKSTGTWSNTRSWNAPMARCGCWHEHPRGSASRCPSTADLPGQSWSEAAFGIRSAVSLSADFGRVGCCWSATSRPRWSIPSIAKTAASGIART